MLKAMMYTEYDPGIVFLGVEDAVSEQEAERWARPTGWGSTLWSLA